MKVQSEKKMLPAPHKNVEYWKRVKSNKGRERGGRRENRTRLFLPVKKKRTQNKNHSSKTIIFHYEIGT